MSDGHGRAGIVFDNDGLFLDTEPCWTRAQEAVFERRGQVFDLEAKQALVGTAPSTAPLVLERLLDPPGQGAEASAEMYDLAVDEIAAGAEPRLGALELLEALRGRWPIAIASNAPRRHLLTGLRRVGVDGQFDVTLGVEDVEPPSPPRTSTCEPASCSASTPRARWRSRTRRPGSPRHRRRACS